MQQRETMEISRHQAIYLAMFEIGQIDQICLHIYTRFAIYTTLYFEAYLIELYSVYFKSSSI